MNILYDGRPADCAGRMEREIRVYDFLDQLGISYKRTDHAPADTMEVCNDIDQVLGCMICKNLFLCNRQQTDYYLLMMPGDKAFRTKELSPQIHTARLSFGSPEKMEELIGTLPGSASIMGLMNDPEKRVQLIMDEDVVRGEFIGCHPCINTSSLRIRTTDLMEKFLPAVQHEPVFVRLTGE